MDRLSELRKEAKLKDIAASACLAFCQIETEAEFIEAMQPSIPNTNVAALLWHSMTRLYESGVIPPYDS